MLILSVFYWGGGGILCRMCEEHGGAQICKCKLLKDLMLAAYVRAATSLL